MSKRNPSLELLRCLLMFGIVVEHTVGQCAYIVHGADFLTDWCVCGFVFLSGWFGVRFSWWKVIKLVSLGAWCALISNLLGGETNLIHAILGVNGYWFLWAYLILMAFAPVLDRAVEACTPPRLATIERRAALMALVLPLAVMQWGWGLLVCVPVVRNYVPHPAGLRGCSFITLICIYLFVRVYKSMDLSRYFSDKRMLLALPVCASAMLCGFWWYWWIPAFVVSAVSFEWFRRWTLPYWLGSAALFIAPSAFSIYLLHLQCGGGLKLMSQFERWCCASCDIPLWLTFVLTAIVTYSVCLALDLLRRVWLNVIKRGIKILLA